MPVRISALLAIVATAGTASAQSPSCLTEAEGRSVVAFALPAAVEAAARRCAPTLPADAFLARGAAGLARRYRSEGGGDPRAATAVAQRFGGSALTDLIDSSTTAQAAEGLIARRIGAILPTGDCAAVSRIVEQLSPLPLGNVAAIAVAFVRLDRERATRTGLVLCPATSAAGSR